MQPTLPFEAIFMASPNAYMLLDRDLRYVAANGAYLRATGAKLEDLLGRNLLEVFPHDPDNPANENALRLEASFRTVFRTGEPDVLALIPYRIPVTRDGVTRYEDHYWSATHTPIFAPDGGVQFVLQHTVNVTALHELTRDAQGAVGAGVLARAERVEERNVALDASLRELRRVFEQSPGFMCYLRGPEHVFEIANAAYSQLVGHREILGKTIREALPEVATQGFVELLDRVYSRGEPFVGRGIRVLLQRTRDAAPDEVVLDFVYQPAFGAGGECVGVIVHGSDITPQKLAQAEILQLARVLDATRDFVGISTPEGIPVFVNEAGRRLVGIASPEAVRASRVLEYFVERQRAQVRDEVIPAAIRDGYWEGELLFRHFGTGEEIPVMYAVFPLRDESDRITALATITRDLRAQKSAEAERARLLENERTARAQAEEANRLKDEFLATVSHELRTPLTSMLGWVRMLRTGMLTPDKRERALETVERNARTQTQLIEDLLDVSRIISGKLALQMEPTEVAAVVGGAVDTVRPAADARGIRLEVAMESGGEVMGDAVRLQQVLLNLLSNAVKFTPAGGRVEVQVERHQAEVEIRVVDNGQGIPREFLPHVFERFRQAEGGTARSLGGLGLGLSIVRHLVEAHGGTVRAESEGPGRGATFTVRLPLARTAPSAPPSRGWDVGATTEGALEGLRVLVVDDEDDVREHLRTLLERAGASVITARGAIEALALVQRERPDLLVSDVGMPGEDGYELIRGVRALPDAEGGATPAIALTTYARPEDRTHALMAGFDHHVAKPADPGELLAVVHSVTTKRARPATNAN